MSDLLDGRSLRARGLELFEVAKNKGQAVTVAIIDVDDFSEVNKVFELERGDRFLDALTKRLVSHEICQQAPIGRLSGDIFILLLDNREPEEAFLELEKLRAHVAENPITVGRGGSLRKHALTISIGIAGFPKDGSDFKNVLSRAMSASRRAKRLGKNRVGLPPDENMTTKTCHYTKTQLEALRQLASKLTENEASLLREALDDLLMKYKRRP